MTRSAGRRVYLHVGAPKTGTTYLQALLGHNRTALKRQGVLYPKTRSNAHHVAAWDLRGTPRQRRDVKGIEGTWDALVRRCNAWQGPTVVLSSELFVFCTAAEIARALGAFDADVHLIYTARDLVRQVPAAWQEEVKNQGTNTYRDFVRAVLRSRRGDRRHAFWLAQDSAAVAARWTPDHDPSRVHVVTAPAPGRPPTLLWERFASVVAPQAEDLDTDVRAPDNASLALLQTEVLRRYNLRHGAELPWPEYRRIIRTQLDPFFVEGIADDRKLVLRQQDWKSFDREARRIVTALTDARYDVVGDLAELLPAPPPGGRVSRQATGPEGLDEREVLDASLDALHALLSARAPQRRDTPSHD